MEISPLFAVDAEELLDNGKVNEAIDLCLEGLKVYPGYPAGEAVLARCYKISGNNEKANEILDSAISKNPFNRALETLKKYDINIPKKVVNEEAKEILNDYSDESLSENEIFDKENIDENYQKIDSKKEVELDFEDINLIPGLSKNIAFTTLPEFNNPTFFTFEFNQFPSIFDRNHQIQLVNKIVDDYSSLASKLENAKIKPSDDNYSEPEINEYDLKDIATETLAKIYFEQGAYNQAIQIYQELKNKYPDKSEIYNEMIEVIEIEKEKELENNENKFKEIK